MFAHREFLRAVRTRMRNDTPKKLDSLRGELFETVNIPCARPEEVLAIDIKVRIAGEALQNVREASNISVVKQEVIRPDHFRDRSCPAADRHCGFCHCFCEYESELFLPYIGSARGKNQNIAHSQ
jgi:hypothetical protein